MGDDPVIDWSAASRNIPGGAQGIREFAVIMLAECPSMIGNVRRGIDENDTSLVRLGAHSLRGAARHFAARPLIDAAATMEELALAGDLRAARAALPQLEAAVVALTIALENPEPGEGPGASTCE